MPAIHFLPLSGNRLPVVPFPIKVFQRLAPAAATRSVSEVWVHPAVSLQRSKLLSLPVRGDPDSLWTMLNQPLVSAASFLPPDPSPGLGCRSDRSSTFPSLVNENPEMLEEASLCKPRSSNKAFPGTHRAQH